MKREAMVRLLAPPSPPCFSSRTQWVEYLSAHAAEQRLEHEPGPLVFSRSGITVEADAGLTAAERPAHGVQKVLLFKGKQVSFNNEIAYCTDCSADYQQRMTLANKCKPLHLRLNSETP